MPFLLTKWYLDGVTDEGRAHVGYAAQLSTGVLKVRYASLLTANAAVPHVAPEVRVRLGAKLPEVHGSKVQWRVPGLEVAGTWTPATTGHAEPLRAELLDEPGALTWECLLPRAQVELRHGKARVEALGYAECLTLREPPWRLPIDELRWGRAHVGDHTLVWIDWQGKRPLRRVFLDGHGVEGTVSDDQVRTSALTLTFQRAMTLRSGDVAKTALGRIPAVAQLLARHRLHLSEEKWLSRASDGHRQGWAVHEVVRWT